MKKLKYLPVVLATFLLAACGGGNENQSNSMDEASSTEATTPNDSSSATASDNQGPNTINLTGDDKTEYNDTAFTVKAGETITLHMKNIGKLPAAAMSHDVVVLPPGSSYTKFGQAATQAKELDKLSSDLKNKMIAHTRMLGPGEEDEITFTLTAPGKYVFLCTFPGHYMTMHGIITAE